MMHSDGILYSYITPISFKFSKHCRDSIIKKQRTITDGIRANVNVAVMLESGLYFVILLFFYTVRTAAMS